MPLNDAVAATVAQQIVSALNVPGEGQQQAIANWKAVIAAIFVAIQQNAIILPSTMVAPPGTAGGPIVGTGILQ